MAATARAPEAASVGSANDASGYDASLLQLLLAGAAPPPSSLSSSASPTAADSGLASPSTYLTDPQLFRASLAYLANITSMPLAAIRQQPALLQGSASNLDAQLSSLCLKQVPSFVKVQTASRSLDDSLRSIDEGLDSLVSDALPCLERAASDFAPRSRGSVSRLGRARALVEAHATSLADLLDIPRLAETCVRSGHAHEALQLAAHIAHLANPYTSPLLMAAPNGHGGVERSAVGASDGAALTLASLRDAVLASVVRLRAQLLRAFEPRGVRLPAASKIVGHLRRLADVDRAAAKGGGVGEAGLRRTRASLALSEAEICLAFLRARRALLPAASSNVASAASRPGAEDDAYAARGGMGGKAQVDVASAALQAYVLGWREVVTDALATSLALFCTPSPPPSSSSSSPPSSAPRFEPRDGTAGARDDDADRRACRALVASFAHSAVDELRRQFYATLAQLLEAAAVGGADALRVSVALGAAHTQLSYTASSLARFSADFGAMLLVPPSPLPTPTPRAPPGLDLSGSTIFEHAALDLFSTSLRAAMRAWRSGLAASDAFDARCSRRLLVSDPVERTDAELTRTAAPPPSSAPTAPSRASDEADAAGGRAAGGDERPPPPPPPAWLVEFPASARLLNAALAPLAALREFAPLTARRGAEESLAAELADACEALAGTLRGALLEGGEEGDGRRDEGVDARVDPTGTGGPASAATASRVDVPPLRVAPEEGADDDAGAPRELDEAEAARLLGGAASARRRRDAARALAAASAWSACGAASGWLLDVALARGVFGGAGAGASAPHASPSPARARLAALADSTRRAAHEAWADWRGGEAERGEAAARGLREERETRAREEAERKAREEAERRAREEAETRAREEAERKAREEEEERKAREEAERRAREEAERKAREEEAERKAREEEERRAREEEERKAREEMERQAREEEQRRVREEAERKAREEEERRAREEAERTAREEEERRAREEQERQARAEQEARQEAERQAREATERRAREEQERRAREEADRLARDQEEQKAREEAEKRAREEKEQEAIREEQERERRAQEERETRQHEEKQRRKKEQEETQRLEEAELRRREGQEQPGRRPAQEDQSTPREGVKALPLTASTEDEGRQKPRKDQEVELQEREQDERTEPPSRGDGEHGEPTSAFKHAPEASESPSKHEAAERAEMQDPTGDAAGGKDAARSSETDGAVDARAPAADVDAAGKDATTVSEPAASATDKPDPRPPHASNAEGTTHPPAAAQATTSPAPASPGPGKRLSLAEKLRLRAEERERKEREARERHRRMASEKEAAAAAAAAAAAPRDEQAAGAPLRDQGEGDADARSGERGVAAVAVTKGEAADQVKADAEQEDGGAS